jgi:hypothetical protein
MIILPLRNRGMGGPPMQFHQCFSPSPILPPLQTIIGLYLCPIRGNKT